MMKRFGLMRLLFDKAGDGGSGGGGAGSLLNTGGGNGGSQTPPPEGNPNPNGSGDKSGGNAGANGGTGTPNWLSALPKELQEDASIKKFTDVQGLAQSYINAQKLLGAEKIAIPSKHATEDDWKQVFEKLGLPPADKYEVKFGDQATIDKKFVDEFKSIAHKNGILPKQAQALADWFSQSNANAETEISTARKAQVEKEIKGLKDEWGKAFDEKLRFANNALANFADDDTIKYLEKTGLANDVRLVKMLSSMGEQLFKEGKIADKQGQSGVTPDEAKKAANAIIMNPEHPYHLKTHPGHKAAIEEVRALMEQAYSKSS